MPTRLPNMVKKKVTIVYLVWSNDAGVVAKGCCFNTSGRLHTSELITLARTPSLQNGHFIDKDGTVALRNEARQKWEDRYVLGHDNLLGRSAAQALGIERQGRQLKLVYLARSAAYFDELHQHELRSHDDNNKRETNAKECPLRNENAGLSLDLLKRIPQQG